MVTCTTFENRRKWLVGRTDRIGGSDAAAIIGQNPYKSNVDLWEEKMGIKKPEDISDKPYVRYGNDAEPVLRQLFILDYPEYEVFYVEHNMWLNDRFPWAHASLDGWLRDKNGRKGIWECKTTEILNPKQWDKWDNQIPYNYYCQILHYFMVTEFEFAVLKAQIKYHNKEGELMITTRHYFIERSECEADIKFLEEAEKKFYKSLTDGVRPSLILLA